MSQQAIEGERLTIYCVETDRRGSRPLYQWLLELAMERGMGGATVTRAIAGFGQHRRLHHQHVFAISEELPMLVQIIDRSEAIDAFLEATGDELAGYTFIREPVHWHRPRA